MNKTVKALLTILAMLAVMAYTVWNYSNEKIDFAMFLVSMIILGIPMVNMINLMIQEWKNKYPETVPAIVISTAIRVRSHMVLPMAKKSYLKSFLSI